MFKYIFFWNNLWISSLCFIIIIFFFFDNINNKILYKEAPSSFMEK